MELGTHVKNTIGVEEEKKCHVCENNNLELINDKKKIEIGLIHDLFENMRIRQHDFNCSGGTHAAAVSTIDGKLLYTMEDIGRHNAVDKVVGKLILYEELHKAKIMTVSGRISYEIVIKCFKAQIPFLAAVSAPSSLAVDYAKELGITLFAFSRDNRTTCYAHPERIKSISESNFKAS